MKKRRLAFYLMLSAMLAGLAYTALRPREPSYEGRSLSSWLHQMESPSAAGDDDFDLAIKHFGSNALPQLLEMLQATDSPAKLEFNRFASRYLPAAFQLPSSYDCRWNIMAAFRVLGDAAVPAIPALTNLLSNQDRGVRLSAVEALSAIGPGAGKAVPALLVALKDPDFYVRCVAAQSVIRITEEPPVIAALVASIEDPDERVSRCAIRTLGSLKHRALAAFPALVQAMDGMSSRGRISIIESLAYIDAEASLPIMTNCLRHPRPPVRIQTVRTLAVFTNQAAVIVPLLINSVQDPEPWVVVEAARCLRSLAPKAIAATPALLKIFEDRNHPAWLSAAQALLKIDPEAAARAGIKQVGLPPPGRGARH
jgi:HEAT repeat protein